MSPRSLVASSQPGQLVNTSWDVSWFLTGVPEGDFSSDLYGARVDISNSAEFDSELSAVLPEEPQVVTSITLCEGGICKCAESEFTTGADGEWRLVYENRANLIRFSVCNLGFRKTTALQGSLQNVFGGKDNEFTRSVRSIPEGKVYVDMEVNYGGEPGTFIMDSRGLVRAEVEVRVWVCATITR